MKFLLAQNMVYMPSYGGANKYNRLLLEELSLRGHQCLAIAVAAGVQGPAATDNAANIDPSIRETLKIEPGTLSYHYKGVSVRSVLESRTLANELQMQIDVFEPDWILIGAEDSLFSLLSTAVAIARSRVVYLARTTLLLPFGPDSALKDTIATERLSKVAHIYALSYFIKDYISMWAGLSAKVVPLAFYGDGPFPNFGSFQSGNVTIINPCQMKGISIFLALARSFSHVPFAAVPTWGTTSDDHASLTSVANIQILQPAINIDDVFQHTRILLVPSLWAEAKGEVVIEAMLRGIPVLASNTGGLPEIKLGTDYVLPVTPIKRYKREHDGRMLPVPVVPEQDIAPWILALRKLLQDETHYNSLSSASRVAAEQYAKEANSDAFLSELTL